MEDKESTSSFSVPKKAVRQQEQFTYPIGGVPVQFPCKPYPTQLQMMSKVWVREGEITKTLLLLDNSPNTTGCHFLKLFIYLRS